MEVDPNFAEFISLLNENSVKYLVVGGYAVNYHGYPRFTGDIDLWLWLDKENLEATIRCIERFGFESIGIGLDDMYKPDVVLQLGYEPYRIDLLTTVDGVEFKSCYERASEVEVNNTTAPFISLDDLLEAKKSTGRAKDIADAIELEKLSDPKK